jgi:hypothetical protein
METVEVGETAVRVLGRCFRHAMFVTRVLLQLHDVASGEARPMLLMAVVLWASM